MTKIYLAGPMSGIAQFNFPAFFAAGDALVNAGWDVVLPADMDDPVAVAAAMASVDGKHSTEARADSLPTWGDCLAADVKMLADDGIEAIIFLPNWEKSRGAKLEAFVGVLCGLAFYTVEMTEPLNIDDKATVTVTERAMGWVMNQIAAHYAEDMAAHAPLVYA